MTINPSAQPHDVYDVLDGSVTEYFQLVDDCIRPNEEINGQYRVTTTANYSQDCPVQFWSIQMSFINKLMLEKNRLSYKIV